MAPGRALEEMQTIVFLLLLCILRWPRRRADAHLGELRARLFMRYELRDLNVHSLSSVVRTVLPSVLIAGRRGSQGSISVITDILSTALEYLSLAFLG